MSSWLLSFPSSSFCFCPLDLTCFNSYLIFRRFSSLMLVFVVGILAVTCLFIFPHSGSISSFKESRLSGGAASPITPLPLSTNSNNATPISINSSRQSSSHSRYPPPPDVSSHLDANYGTLAPEVAFGQLGSPVVSLGSSQCYHDSSYDAHGMTSNGFGDDYDEQLTNWVRNLSERANGESLGQPSPSTAKSSIQIRVMLWR